MRESSRAAAPRRFRCWTEYWQNPIIQAEAVVEELMRGDRLSLAKETPYR
jgi:hypothetical protein